MTRATRTVYAGYGADSQLYIYREGDGPFICCFCMAHDGKSQSAETGAEMADHLSEHVAAGHRVPLALADELRGQQ